jgi:muramidase (phage lysozyme)
MNRVFTVFSGNFLKRRNCLHVLALGICLIYILCGAQNGLAKSERKNKNLALEYSINEKTGQIDGIKMRRKLERLLSLPAVKMFLAVIRDAEAGEPALMAGGCRAANLKKHPAETLPKKCHYPIIINGRRWRSSASGNYQLTLTNWIQIAAFLGLKDFSEKNQALATLELIRRGGGAADAYTRKGLLIKQQIQTGFLALAAGNLVKAFRQATYDWASSIDSPLPIPSGEKIDYVKHAKKLRKKNRPA